MLIKFNFVLIHFIAWFRAHAEVLVSETQDTVNEITEVANKLCIDPPTEIAPRKICITVFRHVDGQVEPQGIRVEG
jgi:hypothetical protein